MTATLDDEVAELRRVAAELQWLLDERTAELQVRTAERDDSEAQKAAIGEVLEVINSAPGNLTPVFDAMLERAFRLCDGVQGSMWTFDGGRARLATARGISAEFVEVLREQWERHRPSEDHPISRLMRGERVVQILDIATSELYRTRDRAAVAAVELGRVRTVMFVAIVREAAPLGAFIIARREVRAYTDKQIALLQNFAAQAVIAMENARLLTETREALEQQTATAEVLQVINSSPGDLVPVFEAILEKAHTLCAAASGALVIVDGEKFRAVADRGHSEPFADRLRRGFPLSDGFLIQRLHDGEPVVHIRDLEELDDPAARLIFEQSGNRTVLAVPLCKEKELFGMIVADRQEVRPFTDKQIALLQNFAAQAVIAMENVRLITETREALEQQTATAEVLQVINSSPGDLKPVFQAMLEKATSLCGAAFGVLWTVEADQIRAAASHAVPIPYRDFLTNQPASPGPKSGVAQTIREKSVLHFVDAAVGEAYRSGDSFAVAAVELGGVRTLLNAPLIKDGNVLGILAIYRKEVRPFTDKQIALLQNFAAQAVIAMENARLLTETQEALEQQTATSEVLQVINSSPGDLAPVFEVMLDKAVRLCEFPFAALWTYDGTQFAPVAFHNMPSQLEAFLREHTPPAVEALRDAPGPVHLPDVLATELAQRVPWSDRSDDLARRVQELGRVRTLLLVPLRKDNALLGAFVAYRQEVRPFTDKQIALLQNFAAQAVIAMENARLLGELQTRTRDLEESLEYQTATSEVLNVISRSTADVQPVLDTVVETAARLCGSDGAAIAMREGEVYRYVSTYAIDEEQWAVSRQRTLVPGRQSVAERVALEGRVVQVADIAADPDYALTEALAAGLRTVLGVPLLREGTVVGTITLTRKRVKAFTERQIELVRTFADQAVIAIENARLITETREALEQQTATAEVLGVINSSPGDLAPVFDAMLEKAMHLCEAAFGVLWTYDGEHVHAAAIHGATTAYTEFLTSVLHQPTPSNLHGRLLGGARLAHFTDVAASEDYKSGDPMPRALVDLGGGRTLLAVPLRKDRAFLGDIVIYRREVRPFTDKQIALLQNFAAQAVIAMENARLLTETREALDQQTATAEVLQVINSSPGDLAPVFDAMLEKATRLCDAVFGVLLTWDGEQFHRVAFRGIPADIIDLLREPMTPVVGSVGDRLVRGERVVSTPDLREWEPTVSGPGVSAFLRHGARSVVQVALHKEGRLLGAITVYRKEVRPFTEKQIALLQNFAAQAVIAMENARLITETQDALEQQTATTEVLQVINSSPGNLAPVFDAVIENSMRLCEATQGHLYIYADGQIHAEALRGEPQFIEWQRRRGFHPITPGSPTQRALLGEQVIHIADATQVETYRNSPAFKELIDRSGIRTGVTVALRRDDALLGTINVYRQEVRPFTEKQIALLQNFAAQAVIAMENARLVTETREALEQQTATAEVLQVINSSPGDLAPVFDAMLEKGMRLCGAAFSVLGTYDGTRFQYPAHRGIPDSFAEYLKTAQPGPTGITRRLIAGAEFVEVADLMDETAYRSGEGLRRALVELGGARSAIAVPLRKDDVLLGLITLYRQEVRPFTDKQIALLQNFAAQAVIAMENARLLDEIRQRQEELRVTFDNMVDGVAMFNETLHLGAWNRNFQQLLQLPDEFLAERHDFDTYIRYLTDRGEFGETDPETQIKRLRARIGDHYSFERARPDGTVIEVRNNPMPGGGIVVIYSDITERKRSEAEIRAARDAAETAYRDLKAAQASLIQAEKMASLGQLTAGIAHEIKNPLNFVNNFADLSVELLDELKETAASGFAALGDDKRAEIDETITMLTGNLEKIAEHGRRADGIVKSMLEHSRGTSGERRSVDLNGLIDEALNLAYHGGRAQDARFNVTLERDFAETIAPIELVPQDITRVCLNLFGNGFYAATKRQNEESDPAFKPTLKVATRDLGDTVEVRVRDNGVGIAPEIKDKLFQPFFTTKPTGEGTGLGLSISYDIVTQQHSGTITVDSRVGEFTEFTIRLPRTHQTTMAEAAS
jgi:GAF domain-containing protein/C4-dicarboxylate-specific signal transduction histidine kinase